MERPTGVTVLVVLSFIFTGLCVFVAFGAMIGGAVLASMVASMPAALVGVGAVIVAGMCLFFAALYAVNGYGLLKLQNWARILTIVLAGLSLLFAAFGALAALSHLRVPFLFRELLIIGVDVLVLTYLFKPHVKQAFGATGF